MCGAQQFQCMSESVPQMIGAHQPSKLVMSTLTYIVVKAQSQQGGRGGTSVGTAEVHCQNSAA